jgi:broad specificity phosphatase PhoE
MRFVFVRHGHYDKTTGDNDTAPLVEAGREEARAAGDFLRKEGVVPDLFCTTRTRRTRETAETILATLEKTLPIHAKDAGFARGKSTLDEKLEEWIAEAGFTPWTVLFVGHHTQQLYCLRELPSQVSIPKDNRGCVLVYEKNDKGQWLLRCHHPGAAAE